MNQTDSNQSYRRIIKSFRAFRSLHDHWNTIIYDAQEVSPCFPSGNYRTDLCCFHLVQATESTHFSHVFMYVVLEKQLSLDMFGSRFCIHSSLFRVAWAATTNQLLLRSVSQWPCRIPGWPWPEWFRMFRTRSASKEAIWSSNILVCFDTSYWDFGSLFHVPLHRAIACRQQVKYLMWYDVWLISAGLGLSEAIDCYCSDCPQPAMQTNCRQESNFRMNPNHTFVSEMRHMLSYALGYFQVHIIWGWHLFERSVVRHAGLCYEHDDYEWSFVCRHAFNCCDR